MPAVRRQDWPERLETLIAQRRRTPFAWGTHDCCAFARAAVVAQTGLDPARSWRLRYRTARGSVSALKRLGGIAALPARAGLPEIPVGRARRGDLVLILQERRLALAVCLGEECAAPAAVGLAWLPTLTAQRAWRVGGTV